ncbi:MAG: magnesium transporter CorA family protein, partial [Candidatus Micrarchaeota archaeon]
NPNILARGADFAVYSILDAIVDAFFPILREMDDEIDDIEEQIFKNPDAKLLSRLFQLKRRIMLLRRIVWPLRDILNVLARRDFEFVSEKNASYFRDVYDHLIRLTETTDSARDMITSSMEGYLSMVSNNLNVIMKKLAAFAAILLAPSLIAGVYGMNFEHIPNSQAQHGFYEVIAIMAATVMLLYWYFKRKEWL